jgi:class 3 adenylate cyclase
LYQSLAELAALEVTALVETEQTQYLSEVKTLIDDALDLYADSTTYEIRNELPDTNNIPSSKKPRHWLQINDVICVFVDMKHSTQLSAARHPKSTAGIYQLFTGTAVRILDYFDPPYIDVRGDGAFALFNPSQLYTALAAAVTFKTFVFQEFTPKVKDKTGLELGAHIGVDQATVLVRKIGMSPHKNRTDRQNEVWAGKPVNMASKLAAMGELGELWVSDRYYDKVTHECARKSCDCKGDKVELWKSKSVAEEGKYDFDTAHVLHSQWCRIHGAKYCDTLLALDD